MSECLSIHFLFEQSHAQSDTATPSTILSPPEQRSSSVRIPASQSADTPVVRKLSSQTQTTPHASPKDSSTTKRVRIIISFFVIQSVENREVFV